MFKVTCVQVSSYRKPNTKFNLNVVTNSAII